jgi:tRNA threonylcarbamoyladenosine modification (KEOPS) complex Cgi121 subunit
MVHTSGVKGSSLVVSVGGFSGASVDNVDGFISLIREALPSVRFQVFDADRVAGWRHLYMAAVNAVGAFEGGRGISRSLEVEALLYASCRDQISQAFEVLGISERTENVALLVFGESRLEAEGAFTGVSGVIGVPDDSVLEVSGEKRVELKSVFGLSDAELGAVRGPAEETLTRLIVERGALLSLRR